MTPETFRDRFVRPDERAALERLLALARGDSAEAVCAANFLLWYFSQPKVPAGRFNVLDVWALEPDARADVLTVFGLIARVHSYPDVFGYDKEFTELAQRHRPAPAPLRA